MPSLDTSVCAISTRKFNEYAKSHPDTMVLIISADLPFAQKRFCDGEQLSSVVPLSMMRSRNFGKDYGVLIQDGPLAGHHRARGGGARRRTTTCSTTQLVPEIGEEPDYDRALSAL